ncbi:hypothetical protein ACFSTC_12915 [Nonomuraea ferruginea]
MRIYVGLAAKGREVPARVLEKIRSVAETAFPVPPEVIRGSEWHGRGVSLFGWTNEPDDSRRPPLLTESGGRVLGLNGHLADPDDAVRLIGDPLGEGIGGCFSAWVAGDGVLSAATAINRVCPVFYAETPELHVVGSRALLVHLAAQQGDRVEHDVLALQTMVRQGFFLSDETPYRGGDGAAPEHAAGRAGRAARHHRDAAAGGGARADVGAGQAEGDRRAGRGAAGHRRPAARAGRAGEPGADRRARHPHSRGRCCTPRRCRSG